MPEQLSLGICECGWCGLPTSIAMQNDSKRGYVKGQPMRYRPGHGTRGRKMKPLDTMYVIADCGYVTPCWVWQGGTNEGGYGRVVWRGRARPAHHAYLELAGIRIPEGMQPDHLCFNPSCVNPEHLDVVTPTENNRRQRNRKLQPADVAEIRAIRERALDAARDASGQRPARLPGSNALRREIAQRFNIHPDYVKMLWRA